MSKTLNHTVALTLVGGLLLGSASAFKIIPIPATPPSTSAPLPVPRATVTITPGLSTPVPSPVPPVSVATPAPIPTVSDTVSGGPSDPLWARQWDMPLIRMPQAWALWKTQKTLSPVTVAVLDTGFVATPELSGRVVNGYDFVHDVARAGDGNGRDADASGIGQFAYHAEMVANLIAAAHDGQGMAGINPQARIVQVRVAGTDGLIDPLDLVDGMRWAAGLTVAGVPANPNPARIINLSLFADFIPLTGCDARIQKAVDEVTAKGVLVIAGAANDGRDAAGYSPAGCRNVLTVTSVTENGERPSYANWGQSISLAAPGGEPNHGIVASSVSGERTPNGTSFAAPHATGVASLLLSVRPKLTPAALRDLVTRNVTRFERPCDPDSRKSCGSGLLNAESALSAALKTPR